LYRSLEDQLTLTSAGAEGKVMTYQELRQAAAAHIRAHPDQYAPFLDVEVRTPGEPLMGCASGTAMTLLRAV
jgi:hypothetical protein